MEKLVQINAKPNTPKASSFSERLDALFTNQGDRAEITAKGAKNMNRKLKVTKIMVRKAISRRVASQINIPTKLK